VGGGGLQETAANVGRDTVGEENERKTKRNIHL
jgi:hypothetical protein